MALTSLSQRMTNYWGSLNAGTKKMGITMSLKNIPNAMLEAAMDHPNTMAKHRAEVQDEIARREAVRQAEWDIVGEAFYQRSPECNDCHYYFYQYWTDTGEERTCDLLERDGGNPRFCLAFDRIEDSKNDA